MTEKRWAIRSISIAQHSTTQTSRIVSPCSFNTSIGKPVGIPSACISLVFLISNAIVRIFLKTIRKKNIKVERFLYLSQVN